jgi:hypothetical protein
VLTRLAVETILSLEHVSLCSPAVCGAARNFAVPQMTGSGTTMLRSELELHGGVVEESRGVFERVAQFQTLTSR